MVNVKVVGAHVKAVGPADNLAEGEFWAIVSVFDVEDRVNDVVQPGAFTETLATWAKSGNQLPVIWAHDWENPFSHIGFALSAEESPEGLLVHGQLDITDNATALQVYRLMKGRRVVQFSFAYDVIEGGWEVVDGNEFYALKKLNLIEVGPCLVGVNPETQLLAIKSAAAARASKAGHTFDAKSVDTLREARDNLDAVIAAAEAVAAAASGGDAATMEPSGDAPAAAGADPAPVGSASEDGQPAAGTETVNDVASSEPSASEPASTPAQDLARLTLLTI